jgi:hypothetical protein
MLVALAARHSGAAPIIVEYRLYVDGVRAPSHTLAPGRHELRVEGIVRNNEILPGIPGGFIQSAYHLDDDANAVAYTPRPGFPGFPGRFWDSETNPAFKYHDAAWLFEDRTLALDETGALLADEWSTRFGEVGAGAFSVITRGEIMWNGATTTLHLIPVPGADVVARLVNGDIAGRVPDETIGDATVLRVPEPVAWALAVVSIGAGVMRRKISPPPGDIVDSNRPCRRGRTISPSRAPTRMRPRSARVIMACEGRVAQSVFELESRGSLGIAQPHC